MSNENKEYFKYFNIIKGHIDHIIEFRQVKINDKDETKSKNELLNELKDFIQVDILENEYFRKFLNIAWKNFEDKDKCIIELKRYFNELNAQYSEAKVLEKATISYQLFTETAKSKKKF